MPPRRWRARWTRIAATNHSNGRARNSHSGRCIVATARSVRPAMRSRLPRRISSCSAPASGSNGASELALSVGRAPGDELTATQRQVAELIMAGRTYREAAAELFISPKTVQWNLSKVYSKLGIRSRAELPRPVARRLIPADPPISRRAHTPHDRSQSTRKGRS